MSKFLKVYDDIFTEKECKDFIFQGEKIGFKAVTSGSAEYHRAMIIDKELANNLYYRMGNRIPKYFNGCRVVGLNDHFRLSKYYSGGYFLTHKDGYNQDRDGNRSVMTLNIFLNDDFKGGETDFFFDDGSLRFSAKPKIGRGALFDHTHNHCGNKVNGIKYLIRTDVMVSPF